MLKTIFTILPASICLLAASLAGAPAMTLEERAALDLSAYRVTDPSAGYFDVKERMRLLAIAGDTALVAGAREVAMKTSCMDAAMLPVLDHEIRLPGFYADNATWRVEVAPLIEIQRTVSDLAAAFVVTGDGYYSKCLVSVLRTWADREALLRFHFTSDDRQAWFEVETALSSFALSYWIVRDSVNAPADISAIDGWLARAARNHLAIPGGPESCCNNHFYRRALYSAAIGAMTADDELFQVGVSALYSAVDELDEAGGLSREISRGIRAVHYQNYALLYLVPIAEIVERQGYPAYEIAADGKTLRDAIDYSLDLWEDPTLARRVSDEEQDLSFMTSRLYYAWMEAYLSRFPDPRADRLAAARRPIFNRSAGGHVSLFHQPLAAIETD